MRQFGSTQFTPNVEGFHQAHFYHELNREEELKAFRKSWEKVTLIEWSPKGPSTMEDYLRWRKNRDKGYRVFELAEPEGIMPHREVLSEEVSAKLVSPLWNSNTENQQLQEHIRQLEDQQ